MKDQPADAGHRAAKVAAAGPNNTKSSNSSHAGQTAITEANSAAAAAAAASGSQSTNFADDDYNEWELGIGDLIIDLDADIEKSSDKQLANGSASPIGLLPGGGSSLSPLAPSPVGTLALATTPSGPMSSSATSSGGPSAKGVTRMAGPNATSSPAPTSASAAAALVEHQATVDKGLKMKIKRKNVGSKSSEAKHEIVQSDAKTAAALAANANASTNSTVTPSVAAAPVVAVAHASDELAGNKSKHSSGKGRSGGHRDKKERKDKKQCTPAGDVNGVLNGTAPVTPSSAVKISGVNLTAVPTPTVSLPTVPLVLSSNPTSSTAANGFTNSTSTTSAISNVSSPAANVSPLTVASVALNGAAPTVTTISHGSVGASSVVTPSSSLLAPSSSSATVTTAAVAQIAGAAPSPGGSGNAGERTNSSSASIPVVKTETTPKFVSNSSVILKTEDLANASPPLKRVKVEKVEGPDESPSAPETVDGSTCTSIGTVTEPECLGPCEPGTSVLLEGIVWQETEGGVLVVNVTWRGKTYVGTLLDCTKHDWAPPRLCDSPVSDMDAKGGAKGRGKRGRGSATTNTTAATTSSPSDNSFVESRSSVQSKLRNVKGRRNAKLGPSTASSNSGFTVPTSPARGDAKRKAGRPPDLELNALLEAAKGNKRSRTTAGGGRVGAANGNGGVGANTVDYSQPSSPTLIECPEPNCGKKYKHINGLRYHQTHAHTTPETNRSPADEASSSAPSAVTAEDSKDPATNSSENEESQQEVLLPVDASPSAAPASISAAPADSPVVPQWPARGPAPVPGDGETVDGFSMVSDLSTLASVAISDSKSSACTSSPPSSNVPSAGALEPKPAPISKPVPSPTSSSSEPSVIQAPVASPSVTVSIPTAHVLSFSSGTGPPPTTTATTFSSSSQVASVANRPGVVTASTFIPPSSLATSPSSGALTLHPDKKKTDKSYKAAKGSPSLPASSPRPLVPAVTASPSSSILPPSSSHILGSPLKPIQPKPPVLTESGNPSLDGIKKDKAKHKKSKNKDKERLPGTSKSGGPNPLAVVSSGEGKDAERPASDSINFHLSPETLAASATPSQPLSLASRPIDLPLDATTPDNSMNENVQSPAYSDISDANDTAPVLESEVSSPSDKEKLCDKSLKSPADGSLQSSVSASTAPNSGNLAPYSMYSYYGQPPYLMPSVRPGDPSSPSTAGSVATATEKTEPSAGKKPAEGVSTGSSKEVQVSGASAKVWSAAATATGSSGECERTIGMVPEQEPVEKKPSVVRGPDEVAIPTPRVVTPSGTPSASVPSSTLTDYPPPPSLQQPSPYPYSYAYMQGFPYGMDPAAYHMHLLAGGSNDPQQHYKDQEKALLQQQQQEQRSRKEELHLSDGQSMEKRASPASREHPGSSSISRKSSPAVHGSSQSSHSRDPGTTNLKEKQSENHQILKENIELKSQMDSGSSNKVKYSQHYDAYERQREEMRRYYFMQDHHHQQQQQQQQQQHHMHQQQQQHLLEQQQHHKMEAEALSFSHHHQQAQQQAAVQQQQQHALSSHHQSSSRSKESRDKVLDNRQTSVPSSPHKPEPLSVGVKGQVGMSLSSSSSKHRDLAKDLSNSFVGKKEVKEEKEDRLHVKSEKNHHKSSHGEGQKPTMETTGPPPPPTNSYAYLHPSYHLQASPHFAHMPFEHAHPMYRGAAGLNPILMSAPSPYGPASHPYLHPQLRYHVPPPPGPCDLAVPTPQHHPQAPQGAGDPLLGSGSAPGTPKGSQKALDLLHQVSQHYTNSTHKIHELQERALMSPSSTSSAGSGNPSSGPGSGGASGGPSAGDRPPSSTASAPSTPVSSERGGGSTGSAGGGSGKGSAGSSSGPPSDSSMTPSSTGKESGATGDRTRSPPPQRHLHTHHHTHVGVGYPIYDPSDGESASSGYAHLRRDPPLCSPSQVKIPRPLRGFQGYLQPPDSGPCWVEEKPLFNNLVDLNGPVFGHHLRH